jgi:glycosyltransferase involved in cell wall biosynthesis
MVDTITVEVVVPVYNERRALPGCVRVLHDYLDENIDQAWKITIVDNASTDGTGEVAADLAHEFDRVGVIRLDRKGRGHALRTAWQRSTADVVAYMDVDLSTGLDALAPLIAPLANGHSDIAIGSRLAAGARTVRGPRRELISRGYNLAIRLSHGARFSDAQCGFKAARLEAVRPLLDKIEDDGWFFDTELLLLAEHNGLRIHEVPVDWVEDTDSRVQVASTAWDDIKGLVRVARAKASGRATVPGLPRRPDPRPAHPDAVVSTKDSRLVSQFLLFAIIGVVSTIAYVLLYSLLRADFPPLAANMVALTITTVFNTEANRRVTFTSGGQSIARIHMQGLVVFAAYYALTSGALLALPALVAHPSWWLEILVLLGASAAGTVLRFVALRLWVFKEKS